MGQSPVLILLSPQPRQEGCQMDGGTLATTSATGSTPAASCELGNMHFVGCGVEQDIKVDVEHYATTLEMGGVSWRGGDAS